MKKRLTAIILTMIMVISTAGLFTTASAVDDDLTKSITNTYSQALKLAGASSFYGRCNRATAYQLLAMGIYKDEPDFSGAGNTCCQYFKNVKKTSGGYTVTVIEGANCIYDLISNYGNEIYNVVYALGTGGSSGNLHILYIRAIIDGYVYFTDSFACSYGGVYYPEGKAIVLSVPKFISSYKSMNGDPYGCVYFTCGDPVKIQGNTDFENIFHGNEYTVTASVLNIRMSASTESGIIGQLPYGTKVDVLEIKNNWGRIDHKGISGWISLEWAEKTGSAENDLRVDKVTADTALASVGQEISWTAQANSDSSLLFYSFDIYKDGELIQKGPYTSSNVCEFVPTVPGFYQVCVTVIDANSNKADLYSDEIECVKNADDMTLGDTDGDGKLTAGDARLALRIAAGIEPATASMLMRTDINCDGKITAADARTILRTVAGLE